MSNTRKPTKPKKLSPSALERELKALTRLFNQGVITAKQHKKLYDVLLQGVENV